MAKHKKVYNEDGSCKVTCDGIVVAESTRMSLNWQLNPCERCGMEVSTTGSSPENDKVLESVRE